MVHTLIRLVVCFCLVSNSSFVHAEPGDCETSVAAPLSKVRQYIKTNGRLFAISGAALMGSALGTTYLLSELPDNLKFLSLIVVQFSIVGVMASPIWEPISSSLRRMLFGVRRAGGAVDGSRFRDLENQWFRTQENYSLNAQMSRNVISQYLVSVQPGIFHAYQMSRQFNMSYAADLIAEAAFRMRTLFRDIDPADPVVTTFVQLAFTTQARASLDQQFRADIENRLHDLENDFGDPSVQEYYDVLLRSWLTPLF